MFRAPGSSRRQPESLINLAMMTDMARRPILQRAAGATRWDSFFCCRRSEQLVTR